MKGFGTEWVGVLAATLLALAPCCTKESPAESGGSSSDGARGRIELRPTVALTPYGLKGITSPTEDDNSLRRDYSIYTSAYYTDPEFPVTNGNFFTGVKFDYSGTLGRWTNRTDYADSLYWPLAGEGAGLDFLAVATDTTALDISATMLWAGQDDRYLHGERNVYGVRISVPDGGDSTELLYATAHQMCSDKSPVEMDFKHTQCCLEFRIHANLDSVIRLDKIVVADAYTSGECRIETHPLETVIWDFGASEPHAKTVPGVVGATPVTGDTLKYSMVLPPQARHDITFFFRQISVNLLPELMAADPASAYAWQMFSVEVTHTTTTDAARWEAGKKYIFDVTVKFGEIIIIPTVAEWTDGDDIMIPV